MENKSIILKWSFSLLICLLLSFIPFQEIKAQGFYFGPKGGSVIGFQNWNGLERDPLFAYHGDLFIESLDARGTGSLFASIGYHVRGSATRIINPQFNYNYTQGFRFNNISLMAGAKKRFKTSASWSTYYLVGIRGEYTVSTNFGTAGSNITQSIFFPIEELTNKITYGISGGIGAEYFLSEFISPFFEFTISPDLSFQYRQGEIPNVTNPYTGQLTTLREREIRNLSIELTIGLKLLRKIVYVD